MSAEEWLSGLIMISGWMAALAGIQWLDFYLGRLLFGPGRKGGR